VLEKPGWLTFAITGENAARLSGTPTAAQVEGRPRITLRVVDQLGAQTIQSFTIGELNLFLPLIAN
jgi:hypothetical protein